MKNRLIFIFLCFAAAVSGCNSHGFIPVGGKVTFENGEPLTKGSIEFSTETFMADGNIKPDGTFTLTSLKPGDGLPPGNYKVTINATETDAKERTTYLVDPTFSNVTTTPLTANVSASENAFDFKVSKPK